MLWPTPFHIASRATSTTIGTSVSSRHIHTRHTIVAARLQSFQRLFENDTPYFERIRGWHTNEVLAKMGNEDGIKMDGLRLHFTRDHRYNHVIGNGQD